MSAITALTHQIPWFLRDPAIAIIGEKCYTTLIYDFDILDGPCLTYAISKGLGFGIVIGGSIVKIPQIFKVSASHSAIGLSLPAYVLETLSYAISLAYAYRSEFPFSTYGENLFMTIQNIVICLQIVHYGSGSRALTGMGGSFGKRSSREQGRAKQLIGWIIGMAIVGGSLFSQTIIPFPALKLLQVATVPIGLASKAPQIISNYRLKSTGNLSAFAVFNALLGCLARVFTTLTEINDPLVAFSFLLSALLNSIIAFQMILYWSQPPSYPTTSSQSNTPRGSLSGPSSGRYGSKGGWGEKTGTEWEAEESGVGMDGQAAPTSPMKGPKEWSRKID
ncbi:Predicted endoplasmic reticulum membrane protein Lec35/MPDU1 involved in monosaccharide-P-dolichol utilization [Phaffia rhodozyma]|uniref:Predicted endoplasmic reticulum membrane protein Lec35/MPDU1 involved in monosaccharide-P-dolichol utilization n=1 Tax=Phaffia rhodozyma TaxID=264483 RepID=A0A0F7SIH7_PHARH|nr:Predicted endoplasmic reticulum membrane protein Lec35/MPDU1 involved in monosaccharide-P-dolichol utilization [Phaffia rhodozyma]